MLALRSSSTGTAPPLAHIHIWVRSSITGTALATIWIKLHFRCVFLNIQHLFSGTASVCGQFGSPFFIQRERDKSPLAYPFCEVRPLSLPTPFCEVNTLYVSPLKIWKLAKDFVLFSAHYLPLWQPRLSASSSSESPRSLSRTIHSKPAAGRSGLMCLPFSVISRRLFQPLWLERSSLVAVWPAGTIPGPVNAT